MKDVGRDVFGNKPADSALDSEAAQTIALEALTFLASTPQTFERFLNLTGLDHSGVRDLTASPTGLAAILEHLLADETALLTFAESYDHQPSTIAAAHQQLDPSGARLGREPW